MFNEKMLALAAQRLAMSANSQVVKVSAAIAGRDDYPPKITSLILGIMPHVAEHVIDTSLEAGAAQRIKVLFLVQYKEIIKIMVESVKQPFFSRMAFKFGADKIFNDEYQRLKPKVNALWAAAKEQKMGEVEYLSSAMLHEIEHALKLGILTQVRYEATITAFEDAFEEMAGCLR